MSDFITMRSFPFERLLIIDYYYINIWSAYSPLTIDHSLLGVLVSNASHRMKVLRIAAVFFEVLAEV